MLLKFFWRALKEARLIRMFLSSVKEITASIKRFIKTKREQIVEKFDETLFRKRGIIRIKAYRDVRTVFKHGQLENFTRFKKMKWKNLQSNRERVRFIYISFLKQKMRQGLEISPADTPNELHGKLLQKNDAAGEKIFPLYNIARYKDDETAIPNSELESVMHLK
ncbi:MAG: hypothetical protein FWE82_01575 [Defluviitaleaceae bacterium]|nr:hypothetical protein [Defluviitaleaceae bacterium]